MSQISLKYKIPIKDQASTLETIKRLGYSRAFSAAFESARALLDSDQNSTITTTMLSWSHNLLNDAREAEINPDELLELSRFYRTLAHKLYWYQRTTDSIAPIGDFLQAVK